MHIRRLLPSDAAAFQALRLQGLREAASAFSSSYEEECATPLGEIELRLAARNFFGAFAGAELAGMVAVGRETALKLRHKAWIRAMYVAPAHRRGGTGRKLMEHAIAFAAALDGVQKIDLALTAGNDAALRLYESLGFQAFGREPNALIVDGVSYDEVTMSRAL
ncbi:GNAT family N-acetyltransferase [Pseudoduganella sp. UC29_106]|uniref:GNAT family N-acetyltransferase n=1 Tax=Pseudoduganella sp. UC29_106 TaxID=3374553 RepID=UPI0037570242